MRVVRPATARVLLPLALLALLSAGACSNYTGRSTLIKQSVAAGDFEKALEQVEEIDPNRSELLYLYEKGLIQHYMGQFEASNLSFEDAEHLLEDLYTKSVTRELAALAITDNITKYRGDPFEAVLVNYYQILNYLRMGDLDGALIECRQVNRKLQMIFDSGVSYFEDDPFLQYLTAMVYDIAGESADAEVSYRVAVDGYAGLGSRYEVTTPPLLACDARELALRLGDREAADSFAVDTACVFAGPPARGFGRVNLFVECGYVAHKEEVNIVLPIFKNDSWDDPEKFAVTVAGRRGVAVTKSRTVDYWLRVALPELVPTPSPIAYAEVRPHPAPHSDIQKEELEEKRGDEPSVPAVARVARTSRVENIDALAAIAYNEEEGKVLLRATTRALIKYAAKKAADSQDEGVGALVNLFNVATESADTRSWSTLPSKILLARVDLPVGTWDLDVLLRDHTGRRVGALTVAGVVVGERHVEFLNVRIP